METKAIRKIAVLTAIVCGSLVFLIALFLGILPSLVSSDAARQYIEKKATEAIHTPVSIEQLNWSWSKGILLTHVRVNDHPDVSPEDLFALKSARLEFPLKELFKRRLRIRLIVSGLTVNVIKYNDGTLNMDRLAPKAPGDGEKEGQKNQEEPSAEPASPEHAPFIIHLPMDISLAVLLNQWTLSYEDRTTGDTYGLQRMTCEVDMPSLATRPIKVAFHTDILLNDTVYPDQGLQVSLDHPPFSYRKMDLSRIAIQLDGTLPGLSLNGQGSPMDDHGLTGGVRLDLARLNRLAGPFLPPDLKTMNVSGTIELDYTVQSAPSLETVSFDTTITVADTTITGGPVPEGTLGPLALTLTNKGQMDLATDAFTLAQGRMTLLANSHFSYMLTATGVSGGDPVIDFNLAPMMVDVKELYEFGTPFLPREVKERPPVSFDTLTLGLESLSFSGRLSETPAIRLKNFAINSPRLTMPGPPNDLTVRNLSFALETVQCTLKEMFPQSIDLIAGLSLSNVHFKGNPEIDVGDIRLADLHLTVDGLAQTESSPLGVTADIGLSHGLTIASVSVSDTAAMANISQLMDISCRMAENPLIQIALNKLDTSLETIQVDLPQPRTFTTGATLSLAVPGVIIPQIEPLNLSMNNFTLNMALDDAMHLDIRANAADMGKTALAVSGAMAMDISRMTARLSPDLLAGISPGGHASLNWDITGRQFTDAELAGLSHAPWEMKKNLAFIDNASLSLGLDRVDIAMTLPEDEAVHIQNIHTAPPLTYTYDGPSGTGRLTGTIIAETVDRLPGAPFKTPQSMTFSLNGDHDELNHIRFQQDLELRPLNIRETVALNLTGLPRLFRTDFAAPVTDALTFLTGDLSMAVTPVGSTDLSLLSALPQASGDVSLETAIKLTGGDQLAVSTSMTIPGLSLSDPHMYTLENLQADIRLEKSWSIVTAKTVSTARDATLSMQVLDDTISNPLLFNAPFSASMDTEETRRISGFLDTVNTPLNPARSLAISRFQLTEGQLPLTLSDLEMDLRLDRGLPHLPYMRLDLFGGTLIMAFSMTRTPPDYRMGVDLAFSGVDTRKIFPEKINARENPDTEVSGKMRIRVPVTPDMDTLVSGLDVDIYFSHIGRRSLERLLYALDPKESNAQIVSQRKLLKQGTPKWIRLTIADGALSLEGQITILNMDKEIPPISRLNIANLSMIKDYAPMLADVAGIIDILNTLSASAIDVTRQTEVTFIQ